MALHRSTLGLALSGSLLIAGPAGAQEKEPQVAPWPFLVKATIRDLAFQPWPAVLPEAPRQRHDDFMLHSQWQLAGSATVEVWGNEPQEALNLLRKQLYPELQVAFQAGWSSNVSAQLCGEIFAMASSGQEIKAPTTPSVFYNCLRPNGADPRLQALLAYTSIP